MRLSTTLLFTAIIFAACSDPVPAPGDTSQQLEVGSADGVSGDAAVGDETVGGDCAQLADGSPCDDGDGCTLDDQCAGGVCVGGVNNPCDTDEPCEVGQCDSESGECLFTPLADGEACDAACFDVGTCQAGECVVDPDTELDCSDVFAELKAETPCLEDVRCASETGTCTDEIYAAEDTVCDTDSSACSVELCNDEGACEVESTVDCSGNAAADPCNKYTCDKKDGSCKVTGFVGEVSCDDGSPCTQTDLCFQDEFNFVSCQGTPIDVDDGSECTNDSCNGLTGEITHTPNVGAGCTAKTQCSDSWTCDENGQCVAGAPNDSCNDGLGCTTDSCGLEGECLSVVNEGSCLIDGACYPDGAPNEGNPCEVCDVAASDLVWSPAKEGAGCQDGNPCSLGDTCDGGGQCLSGGDMICKLLPCSSGECNPQNGLCEYIVNEGSCYIDGSCYGPDESADNACQVCDPKQNQEGWSPVDADVSCSDGDPCNGDEVCDDAGACEAGVAQECDDASDCTDDSCDPVTGECVFTPIGDCPVPLIGPTNVDLKAVWGSADNKVWAVGDEQTVIWYTGEKWLSANIECAGSLKFFDVSGATPDDVWIGCNEERLIHYNGTSWHCLDDNGNKYTIGAQPNDHPIYKVWTSVEETPDGPVSTALAFNYHWVGGGDATYIYKWMNDTWTNNLLKASEFDKKSISGRPAAVCAEDEIWVAGAGLPNPGEPSEAAQLKRYNGTKTLLEPTQFQDLQDPYFEMRDGVCLSSDNVVMAGYYGQVVSWDGTKLTKTNLYTELPVAERPIFWSVDGNAEHGIYAVGDKGAIAVWKAGEWKIIDSGVDAKLNGVWVSPTGIVWIVGDDGTILKIE